ncbi:MAG: SseB family protein [Clostridia bacterium]|nr:SseB family protein [Clostridia bacterium]
MEPKKLSREKLEDGNILLFVKERFQDDMTEDNLVELMKVLRDSTLILPMQVIMSAADAERMRLYEENMKFVAENDISVVPATAKIDDGNYMFIFSQPEQIPVEYSESVTLMRAPFEKVYQYFSEDSEVDSIVLDPFTENLELPRELINAIAQMESQLEDEA